MISLLYSVNSQGTSISPTRFKDIWVKAANEIVEKLGVEFTPAASNFQGRQHFLANRDSGAVGDEGEERSFLAKRDSDSGAMGDEGEDIGVSRASHNGGH